MWIYDNDTDELRWLDGLLILFMFWTIAALLAACTTPRDTPRPPTRVDVEARPGCEPISEAVVRAELDSVMPRWEEALWPGFSVTLWPGRARSVPEGSLIIVDCDLSGLAEEVERLVAGREGER